MVNSLVLRRRSSEPDRDHGRGKVGEDDDDGDREKDPRPVKRRRVGSLHCASRRLGADNLQCSVRSVTTMRQMRRRQGGNGAVAARKKSVPTDSARCYYSERLVLLPGCSDCSTMSLHTPPTSPITRSLSRQGLVSSSVKGRRGGERQPPLRKLLPKIGFDWAVCEARNRHTRKVERRLAGLEGRERRAMLRGLSTFFSGDGRELDKKGVERGLVKVFEGALGVLRGDEMKMRGLKDQSLFWEEVISHSPSAWFSRGEITGEMIYGLVLLTVEARLWDKEHGVKIGWMNTARERSRVVKVVDEFIEWLEENEDEGVKKGYFAGIEGAIHLDFFGRREDKMLELFMAGYLAADMEVDVDFEVLLADELGDLMARLVIDADEEMVDVDWEDWEWWLDEGIW
ncbi:hypothetical protein QBC40DRAFT_186986 [Triangularia verruculosa]|uniref:Uncharacterized protein n=1 Tax=Triangularia verruculosa TaxID=2587418 RepID=A0AAN7AQ24_9PEZI|nr:hypothetical protein QBC40DRAFT_186986 [Triangularia verruculosa]